MQLFFLPFAINLISSPPADPLRRPPHAKNRFMPHGSPAPVILGTQEKAELEQLSRRLSAPRRSVDRARIILLAAENQTVATIATTLHLCANTVRKWIRRYTHRLPPTPVAQNSGLRPVAALPPPSTLCHLADAPRSGRPDTFTAEQICAVIALACEKPEEHGRPITHWSARELQDLEARRRRIDPDASV